MKPGGGAMVSNTVVEAVTEPEAPMMVIVIPDPMVAVEDAASVSTLELVAGVVEKEAVTPAGSPVADKAMLPVKPPCAVTVMVSVLLDPWLTERAGELRLLRDSHSSPS